MNDEKENKATDLQEENKEKATQQPEVQSEKKDNTEQHAESSETVETSEQAEAEEKTPDNQEQTGTPETEEAVQEGKEEEEQPVMFPEASDPQPNHQEEEGLTEKAPETAEPALSLSSDKESTVEKTESSAEKPEDEKATETVLQSPEEPKNNEKEASEELAEEADSQEDGHDEEGHEEDEDFSHYSLEQIVQLSKDLSTQEDIKKADKVFNSVRQEVDRSNQEELDKQLEAYKQINEGNEEGFVYKIPESINTFYTHFKSHNQRKKNHYAQLRKERDDNLKAKQAILAQIKAMVDDSDQKGSLSNVKELQAKWKDIGSVPQTEAENLYRSYSALLDLFYDQKSIEYDLKELDRKKNLETKIGLCEKAEALLEEENLNSAAKQLNKLHEEYKATGPIPKENQEDVWQRFKAASDEVYDRKRAFAEEYKKQLQENMEQKQALCLKLEPFVSFDSDRIKEWNAKTKELLDIQKEWEKIGALPREVAKDINKQFWGNFKTFFANKSKFFEKLEESRKENLTKKEKLCEEAEAVKESTDWNSTADKLKKLQADWKNIGPVPESHRDSIYQRFKGACDEFFERKRNKRSHQEKEFEENLQKKEAIINKIKALADQKKENAEALEALKKEYLAIGYVPRKNINSILENFLSAIDKYYDNLPYDEEKLENMKLEARVEIHSEVPGVVSKLNKQEQTIRKKISHLENDIALWVNNLEFFANSKTADKLKSQFTKKIEDAQKQLNDLKAQLKMIRKIQ